MSNICLSTSKCLLNNDAHSKHSEKADSTVYILLKISVWASHEPKILGDFAEPWNDMT